jgi:hypothetical protein
MDMNKPMFEYLVDRLYIGDRLSYRIEQPAKVCPCNDTGWLGREWLENRDPQCTCGSGDPASHTIMHKVSCDAVPCPFEEDHDLSDHEPQGSGRED